MTEMHDSWETADRQSLRSPMENGGAVTAPPKDVGILGLNVPSLAVQATGVSLLFEGDWQFGRRPASARLPLTALLLSLAALPAATGVPATATVNASFGFDVGSFAAVPMFPAADDDVREGFVRIINHSHIEGIVRIAARDENGADYGPVTLHLAGSETAHINSSDLEEGNAEKGLSGGIGAGASDWHLDIRSLLNIEVLTYVRTRDGFLTAMQDVVEGADDGTYTIAIFNPGSNTAQVSVLRLANPNSNDAEVVIKGLDGRGDSPGSDLTVTVPAGAARSFTAAELEAGTPALEGALGDGHGKWQLLAVSETPVQVMSLLESPTGHLTNLSTAPASQGYRDEFPGSPLMHMHNDNVLVMHVTGDTASITYPNPSHTKPVYEWFDDVFDFLILLPNVDSWFSSTGLAGSYTPVMNDTAGVGREIFYDNRYGSAGTLRGFDRNDLIDLGGRRYAAGQDWRPNENGGNRLPYSPIELYLAGYVAPETVPDLWVAADGQWLVEDGTRVHTKDGEPVFTAADVIELTIDDIVAENGMRDPGTGAAQSAFRGAIVLLVGERQPLFSDDLAIVSKHARIFAHPGAADYHYCGYRDPGDPYTYIRACGGFPNDAWRGLQPTYGDAGIRLYNYYEATGGNGMIALDGMAAIRREKPLQRELPQSVGSPSPPANCSATALRTNDVKW